MEFEELRALTKKATPGPWQRNGVRKRVLDEDSIVVATPDGKGWAFVPIGKDEPGAIADASFIAATNPQAVLELMDALQESVNLQSHYASLLNMYDGGERIQFKTVDEWLDRLATLKRGL